MSCINIPNIKGFFFPGDLTESELLQIKRDMRFKTKNGIRTVHHNFIDAWVSDRAERLAGLSGEETTVADMLACMFVAIPFCSSSTPYLRNMYYTCDIVIYSALLAFHKFDLSAPDILLDKMQFLFHKVYNVSEDLAAFLFENRVSAFNDMTEKRSWSLAERELLDKFAQDEITKEEMVDKLTVIRDEAQDERWRLLENCFSFIQYDIAYDAELRHCFVGDRVFACERNDEEQIKPFPLIDYYALQICKNAFADMIESYCEIVARFKD